MKEKIARKLLMGFKGTELSHNAPIVEAILKRQIGGVILFASNIQSPQQLKNLNQQLYAYANESGIGSFSIGIDYEGGTVERLLPQTGFPKTLTAEEMGKLPYTQVRQHAEQMADTLQQGGFNLNFAPVVDVNINPINPIIGKRGRSFSCDPAKVAECAEIFIKTYNDYKITCALKHFPGHGSSLGDTHTGFVDVTNTWQEIELFPYEQLLSRTFNQLMVMTSHVVHFGLDSKGYPASLSQAITENILRKKLNYNGVIITDDLQMGAITNNYSLTEAVTLAVNADADILIFGNQLSETPQDPEQIIHIISEAIDEGRIRENKIEESYLRIAELFGSK